MLAKLLKTIDIAVLFRFSSIIDFQVEAVKLRRSTRSSFAEAHPTEASFALREVGSGKRERVTSVDWRQIVTIYLLGDIRERKHTTYDSVWVFHPDKLGWLLGPLY